MVSVNSSSLKILAVAAAGFFSLARCAAFSPADSTSTAQWSATESAADTLTSGPGLAPAGEAESSPFTDTSLFEWPGSKYRHTNVSQDQIDYVANILGITAEQMARLQLETTDSEFAEPAHGLTPNRTNIELVSTLFQGRLSIEDDDEAKIADALDITTGAFELTEDERKTIERLKTSQDSMGFLISLLNSTPYRWELVTSHLRNFGPRIWEICGEQQGGKFVTGPSLKFGLPKVIKPGMASTLSVEPIHPRSWSEFRYRLVGTAEEAWFTVKVHQGRPHRVTVEYGGALETVSSDGGGRRGSTVDLGVERGVQCPTFYLAGAEGRFYANDAPANWMHALIDDIGSYTLRDVVLPRSHHSGMYTLQKKFLLGSRANTLTQDYNVYDQLKNGGVRVLDIRPVVKRDGTVWEAHGAKIAGQYNGVLGVSHDVLIEQINQFNDEHPGELVIIDVDGQDMRDDRHFDHLRGAGVAKLIESFKRLKHRAVLVPGQDVTAMPIADLIGCGQTAVIVRMEEYRLQDRPARRAWPGAAEGFVTAVEMPFERRWSDMKATPRMAKDQIARLAAYRARPDGRALFSSEFVLTQQGMDVLGDFSIRDLNEPAWAALTLIYWEALRSNLLPNWLSMDAIRGSALKGVAMAANHCLVARRCGPLGGKVLFGGEPRPLTPTKQCAASPVTTDASSSTV